MKKLFRNLQRDDAGQDLAEYAMLLVLVAIVVIAVLGPFANAVSGGFNQATAALFGGP